MILYPANIRMEKICYHTVLSSVNSFTRKEKYWRNCYGLHGETNVLVDIIFRSRRMESCLEVMSNADYRRRRCPRLIGGK